LDQKLLLNEALAFLHLSESSTEQDLKATYHLLAKKYHPDTGEFDSDILFQELQKHYEFLKTWWNDKGNFILSHSTKQPIVEPNIINSYRSRSTKQGNDPIFNLYKLAKEVETRAILDYFEKTKNTPLELHETKNKNLSELRKALEPAKNKYQEIVKLYPQSIWAKDSGDSLQRLSVWWK
jgi:hypothetical protein